MSTVRSFLGFTPPILFPVLLEEGRGVSKWLCGYLAAGQGQPTTLGFYPNLVKLLPNCKECYACFSVMHRNSRDIYLKYDFVN